MPVADGQLETALIAGGSALLGGLLSAAAGVRVERLRQIAAQRERAEKRLIEAVQRFATSTFAWFEWLGTMAENTRLTREQLLDENNRRSRDRQQAYRELKLLCSDESYAWLETVYDPVEYRVRRDIVAPLIRGEPLSEQARQVRREYDGLIRKDMIEHFRPEVASLRPA